MKNRFVIFSRLNCNQLFRYTNEDEMIDFGTSCSQFLGDGFRISNPIRAVFGIMHYPEKTANTILCNKDGVMLFELNLGMMNA